jgi:hypothetical protein
VRRRRCRGTIRPLGGQMARCAPRSARREALGGSMDRSAVVVEVAGRQCTGARPRRSRPGGELCQDVVPERLRRAPRTALAKLGPCPSKGCARESSPWVDVESWSRREQHLLDHDRGHDRDGCRGEMTRSWRPPWTRALMRWSWTQSWCCCRRGQKLAGEVHQR